MRNLSLQSQTITIHQIPSPPTTPIAILSSPSHTTIVTSHGTLTTTSTTNHTTSIQLDPPAADYFYAGRFAGGITCLSRGGHVVSIHESSKDCELIGTFERGLECGAWSPDGEVLALLTFAEDDADAEGARIPILMTMNSRYEIMSEVRLDPCLAPVRHGDSQGMQLVHPPHAISLVWRPDSSSLAVSTMDTTSDPLKPLRRVRTMDRTSLQLLSLSKEEDGSGRDVPNLLSVPPTWAPAGCSHHVGVVQSSRPLGAGRKRPIALGVAFLEPNGLRHGECGIRRTWEQAGERGEVTGVWFNGDGDLLAVVLLVTPLDTEEEGDPKDVSALAYGKLQLYHRSNYHWYLKYELGYKEGTTCAAVSSVQFSSEDPYKILVGLDKRHCERVPRSVEWREYTFRWDSSKIHCRNGLSPSVVAMVIDGKTLHSTPLDGAIVPPPMYASSLEFRAPIVNIATRPTFCGEMSLRNNNDEVELIVVLSDGSLSLVRYSGGSEGESLISGFSPPSIMATMNLSSILCNRETLEEDGGVKTTVLRDISIIDANTGSLTAVAVSSSNASTGGQPSPDNLIEMNISWSQSVDTSNSWDAQVSIAASVPLLEERALRVVNWADTSYTKGARGSALVELADGTLLRYSQGGVVERCEEQLLEPCPWIMGLFDPNAEESSSPLSHQDSSFDRGDEGSSNCLVIGLSSRHRLYCGERLISSASSSFDISLQHRFLTHVTLGSQPKMHFIPLSTLRNFDPLMGFEENSALDGYEPRSVERGARLVTVFPISPSVVIQLPRGNLEMISPRALALPFVMTKIRDRNYIAAIDIMRRQRIDMNLIVDLDPVDFLVNGGAEEFVGQIVKMDIINLFLSCLIDVDTTVWKYPVPSWLRKEHDSNPGEIAIQSKVNRVCCKMRDVMLSAEKNELTPSGMVIKEGHFLLPVLSTFAKETPPRLEDALSLIKNSASQKNPKKSSNLLSDEVQSSIQYLAFLADYQLIFNTAIGMYDFDLAKAVARHSQIDPKIYLPMLKRWREMPKSTACHEVDVQLKRYESALRHLVASGSDDVDPLDHFEKCLEFIVEHKLHTLGIYLFKDDERCSRIMASFGEHLMTEKKFVEATTVFLASDPKHFEGAKRAARACGDWKTYFMSCGELGEAIDSDQINAIVESISSKMGSMLEQSEGYSSAARILLDYGHDVAYAMDMLLSARMWYEGRRIAVLYGRQDLAKQCCDSAVKYATSCISDLSERSSTFETTVERYAEVIAIRRVSIKEADTNDHNNDDNASVFSMQSNASITSLRSTASGSSVGSVTSVSTVISASAKSTFSFTGDRDTMKHKSKFNKIGRDRTKKKKKKDGPASRRMKPGSEEELNELLLILNNTCPDEHYIAVIGETITFLLQCGEHSSAKSLFDAYRELETAVTNSQTARLESDRLQRQEEERMARRDGLIFELVEHPSERGINNLACTPLPLSVTNVLSYFDLVIYSSSFA